MTAKNALDILTQATGTLKADRSSHQAISTALNTLGAELTKIAKLEGELADKKEKPKG